MKKLLEGTILKKESIWYHGSGFNGAPATKLRRPSPKSPLYLTNDPHFAGDHMPDEGKSSDGTFYIFILNADVGAFDMCGSDVNRLNIPDFMKKEFMSGRWHDLWTIFKLSASERDFTYRLLPVNDFRPYPFPEGAVKRYLDMASGAETRYDREKIRQYFEWFVSDFTSDELHAIAAATGKRNFREEPYLLAGHVYSRINELGYNAVLTKERDGDEQTLVLLDTDCISYASNFRRPLSFRESNEFFEYIKNKNDVTVQDIAGFLAGLDYKVPSSYEDAVGGRNTKKMTSWRAQLSGKDPAKKSMI